MLPFPYARVKRRPSFEVIGIGAIARQLDLPERYLYGHWCHPCRGMWFGTASEVECPACGNRGGWPNHLRE